MTGYKGMKMHVYSDEQVAYLRKNKDLVGRKLEARFNKKFGTNLTQHTLRSAMKRRGIVSANNCQFKPGNVPFNKGKKGVNGKSDNRFKPGDLPPTTRPVGSERINRDGYIEIKVEHPNKWLPKQRHIWEQHHNRTVPDGHIVIFMDKDNRNFDPDNLRLISKAVNGKMSKSGYHDLEPEFKDVMINVAQLDLKVKEVSNEHRSNQSTD